MKKQQILAYIRCRYHALTIRRKQIPFTPIQTNDLKKKSRNHSNYNKFCFGGWSLVRHRRSCLHRAPWWATKHNVNPTIINWTRKKYSCCTCGTPHANTFFFCQNKQINKQENYVWSLQSCCFGSLKLSPTVFTHVTIIRDSWPKKKKMDSPKKDFNS